MKLKFFIALLIAFPLYSMHEQEQLLAQLEDSKIF